METKEHKLHTPWILRYSSRMKKQQDMPHSPAPPAQRGSSHDPGMPASPRPNVDEYKQRLKDITTVTSLEELFTAYKHLRRPSEMPRELDLSLFRKGEEPLWETSPHGGCWIIKIRKFDNIDALWERLIFGAVGEQFEGNDENVIGVLLSLRLKERLMEIWIKDGRNEKKRYEVSRLLKVMLALDSEAMIFYKPHNKSIEVCVLVICQDGSTMRNAEGFKFTKKKKRPRGQPMAVQYHSQGGAGQYYEGGEQYQEDTPPHKSTFYRPKQKYQQTPPLHPN